MSSVLHQRQVPSVSSISDRWQTPYKNALGIYNSVYSPGSTPDAMKLISIVSKFLNLRAAGDQELVKFNYCLLLYIFMYIELLHTFILYVVIVYSI